MNNNSAAVSATAYQQLGPSDDALRADDDEPPVAALDRDHKQPVEATASKDAPTGSLDSIQKEVRALIAAGPTLPCRADPN